jgi:membrane protein
LLASRHQTLPQGKHRTRRYSEAKGIVPEAHRLRWAWHEFAGLYWESGLCDDVPALAWFLLASLVPLTLGLTALAAVVLGDYAQAQALADRAAGVLPRDVHDQLVQLLLRTRDNSPLLILGSVLAMVWVSSGAVGVVERVLSRLLRREREGPVLGKLRNLVGAAALAVVILVLVIGASAATGLVHRLNVDSTVVRVFAPLMSLAVSVAFCAALYRSLSSGTLRWRTALAGGVVGGLALLITPTVAGYYVSTAASRTPVGVFLVLAGILFTCYTVSLGLLLGAGVSARVELGRSLPKSEPRLPVDR